MIILFDMDGTLTPARKPMSHSMAKKIGELTRKFSVGIVTGSGLTYVLEQCGILKSIVDIDWEKIYLLPCNGTQFYHMKNGEPIHIFSADMKKLIGEGAYRLLVAKLCYEQAVFSASPYPLDIFGTFIQYRGSLLNWCPIGRDSDYDEKARERFIKFDKDTNFREEMLRDLRIYFEKSDIEGLTITLGGDTSFDIYPDSWDKTYALRHFANEERIVFVGDRCKDNGNDRAIYEACLPDAYETTGPKDTMKLIQQFLDES